MDDNGEKFRVKTKNVCTLLAAFCVSEKCI